MDIERLTKEVRATGGVFSFHQLFRRADLPTAPTLVHGSGPVAIAAFYNGLAAGLSYGSAVVIGDLNTKYLAAINDLGPQHDWMSWVPSGLADGEYAWIRSIHDGNKFPTYKQHLIEAVKQTKGPVLCFGANELVTPVLHKLCEEQDRLLVTVEGDTSVLEKFEHLIVPHHFIDVDPDPSRSKWLERDDWGVIFIDHAQGSTRRVTIETARTRAELVVVHDSENLEYGLALPLDSFKHKTDFHNSRPWTTVASMVREVWAEEAPEVEKERFLAEASTVETKLVPAPEVEEIFSGPITVVQPDAFPGEDFPSVMETPVDGPRSKRRRVE